MYLLGRLKTESINAKIIMRNKTGFSIIELLIAMAVFVLLSASISVLMFSGEDLLRINLVSYKALLYAQEGIEAVRSIRDGDWQYLTQGSHGLAQEGTAWIFSGISDIIEEKYRRSITLISINENKFEVISQVNWFNNFGQEKNMILKSYLTNWQRTQQAGSGVIDLGDSAKDIYVSGNYTYLAIDDQHKSMAVIDTTNPSLPQIISTLDINGKGKDVVISGNYAYLAVNTNKIAVIDISDPRNPNYTTSINVSAQPTSVYVYNNYLYIGQDKQNEGLIIYNVANPETPYFYASYNVGAAVHDIKVVNGWIYMAINAGRGFDVVDKGYYAYAFVAVDSEKGGFETYYLYGRIISRLVIVDVGSECNNVYYYNNIAYVAAKAGEGGLIRINVASAYAPYFIDNFNIGGEGNGVFYKNSYSYMAVENVDGGLAIVNTP
ncbi:prepilin-type N-terminal cleavage/methylation domain-containing protein [bacterium]|nr:MAG: prepilin-type N-terminal cleavage/methylation domain-containing protein [bacterium]